MGDPNDELARTATAVVEGGTKPVASEVPAIEPVGPTLGRYMLEREIGQGGMGVVHAAFDPDLERRVALKVLRTAGGEDEDKLRLLREARAMARLAHPNVVTVHEVGSAHGRDYVAMELIEGETLGDWLREPRTTREIIDAFVQAGRGLAAAHAAGMVHRDFKPHNILRNKQGRIVVTDFGLAREAAQDPMAVTLPMKNVEAAHAVTGRSTPSSSPLAGVTVTGSVLGTPAYMAPEQWAGGAVTQATDQFAFSVALWEALAGERPFRAPTIEKLRDEVARGPELLDASKIPRRLRGVLKRGLDPNPSKRFPNMEGVLAAIVRAQRRPVVAIAVASGVAAAGAVFAYAATRNTEPTVVPPEPCRAAVLDPDKVWTPAMSTTMREQRAYEASLFDRDMATWRDVREKACAPAARDDNALACLDGVLTRIDVIARAMQALPANAERVDPGELLIDPIACTQTRPPQLLHPAPPEYREVVAFGLSEAAKRPPSDDKAFVALADRVRAVPCAATAADLLIVTYAQDSALRAQRLAEAEGESERCDDDRLRADVATAAATQALQGGNLSGAITAKIKVADGALGKVGTADAKAGFELLRMEVAARKDNLDDAIARGEAAMAGFAQAGRLVAQLDVGLTLLTLRDLRSKPGDREYVVEHERTWRELAVQKLGARHPIVRRLDSNLAVRMFHGNRVEDAHRRLAELREPVPFRKSRHVTGVVVDASGAPVAGATVVAGRRLRGDSYGVAIALTEFAPNMREVKTNAAGEFDIPDGPENGVVVAQRGEHGEERSSPQTIADKVKLVLEPTSTIEGKVDLKGLPARRVVVAVQRKSQPLTVPYDTLAPVSDDGTFLIKGAPRGSVRVIAGLRNLSNNVVTFVDVDVNQPVVQGVQLAVNNSQRVVYVVVRSEVGAPVVNAQVIALPGKHDSTTYDQLDMMANIMLAQQIEGEHAPAEVNAIAHPGDLYATVEHAPEGVATVCAVGFPAFDDPSMKKALANLKKIKVRCQPINPTDRSKVVEVPPWPRLE